MIFAIGQEDIHKIDESAMSDLVSDIMLHGHYIECNAEVRELIKTIIERNGSTTQKQLFAKYKGFDITKEFRQYLTTVVVSDIKEQETKLLASKESCVLMENSREWSVYQNIIGCYKNDRSFSNLFTLLEMAKQKRRIIAEESGGKTNLLQVFKNKNDNDYLNVARYKFCIVFDRDTNDANSFSPQNNSLFRFLCNKDSDTIRNEDIYTLDLGNYVWHMWYRREIENYFPKSQFEKLKYSLTIPESDDSFYKKADEKYKKTNGAKYNKNDLPNLTNEMDRCKYDNNLQQFNINGINVSELQLFLLKLLKII